MEEERAVEQTNQSPTLGKLAEALSKAQGEMEGAKKDSENPFYRQKYADLASVWEACRKQLSINGLSIVQTTDNENGRVVIITTLLHSSGEWIRGKLAVKPMKDDPQAMGSAITYGRRYSLAAIAGISPEDDDAEGAMERGKPKPTNKPPLQEPQPRKTEQPQGDQLATEKQKRLVWAKLKEAYTNDNDAKAGCVSLTGKESSKDWTNADVQRILDHLNGVEKPMFPSTPEPNNDILTPEKCYELAEIYKGKIETATNTTDLETWYQAMEEKVNQIKGIEMDAYAEIMKAYDKRWKEVGE